MHVTLLTQDDCAFCDDAKELLARLSREYPLEIQELDLGSDEGRRLAEAGGMMFAPGIVVDGEPFCYGRPSERKIRRELNRRLGR
jgi:glutaredoxin